jgi:hypothetical protein
LPKSEISIFLSALICIAFAAIITIFHVSDTNRTYPPLDKSTGLVTPMRPPGRILVILIDSARADFMFSPSMPFISELRRYGAWGISEVVNYPLSIAGDAAIFSGKIPNPFWGLLNDFESSPSSDDSIFRRLAENRRSIAVLSSDIVRGMYGQYAEISVHLPSSFRFSQYKEEANSLFSESIHLLKDKKWDFAVVQFIALDYVGHLETPLSQAYRTACLRIDKYVRQLVALTGDDDTVLITSEHGIDNGGFHVDQNPLVTNTPFVLKGPWIRRGEAAPIKQIDLAPTLSALAGVSPIYDSLALPAFDLLDIDTEYKNSLLNIFSQRMGTQPESLSSADLRTIRNELLKITEAPLALTISVAISLALSLFLLLYMVLVEIHQWRSWRMKMGYVAVFVSLFFSLAYVPAYVGLHDVLENFTTFSANFILSHFTFVIAIMVLVFFLSFLYGTMKQSFGLQDDPLLLLFLFITLLAFVLLAHNPYNTFNWIILFVPLVGWGITRRTSWMVILISLLIGLLIRRLSLYHDTHLFTLPERWQIAVIVIVGGVLYQYWQHRNEKGMRDILMGLIALMPAYFSLLSNNIEIRVLFILISLIPLAWFTKVTNDAMIIWWVIWTVLLLLGTSSKIELTTHVIVVPLAIAILSASHDTSIVTRAILGSIFFWSLYMISGNNFDFKLMELRDGFTLSAARTSFIGTTVFIILMRYLLPNIIAIWLLFSHSRPAPLLSAGTIMITPIVFAAGLRMIVLLRGNYESYPWEEYTRLIVLLVSVMLIVLSLAIVFLVKRIGNSRIYSDNVNHEKTA